MTKSQKKEHVASGAKKIQASKNLIFADFSGVSTADVNKLKAELRKQGASFQVIKKRLLNIALKEAGVTFDPLQFKAPIGTIFTTGDLSLIAGPIYKFTKDLAKQKINFTVVGAFDREKNEAMTKEEFLVIAKLPSREILLGQVIGAITGPLRAFMYLCQQIAKQKEKMVEVKTNN